ncbi:putative quinoprotein alcohol dehydrogenase-like superfamily [Septoria linicola]|nr:putative quinoprotein alcohol dehydrogenase-like superfamily [Septoria linicola]
MVRSLFSKLAVCLASFSFPHLSLGLGKTDTITWGGDNSRAGYETNHNLDPRVIASADFGNIWIAKLSGNFGGIGQEQVLSQPLVYTAGDGIQYVYVATTQNNLYKINAKTGDIVKTRNVGVPFLAADLNNCNDISPAIGVSGTGVIDPSTGLWYFTSKTYSEQFQGTTFGVGSSPGRANGRYYFHAVSTEDLSSAPNFPRPVHGTVFRNNNRRMLIAGDQHQRPALLQVGQYIYTGWASHCIQYNYTGAVIGFDKTTGAIVEAFATQGGAEANTVPGGGIWMSGGGLAYDGAGSMFFSTGKSNGYAAQLPATGHPVQGRQPPTALEEAVVNMKLHDDGTIEPVDFFMPWEKTQLDGADKDLGTTPFQLMPSTFTCPNSKRIGMITGKSGKTYWLNVDDLGGYQLGANRLDRAIQVFQHENAVYSAAGIQPVGKYVYINVINYQTRVFQFSCDAGGNAKFTEVSKAAEKNAQALGVGHGTTTSLDGREGTGLYWTTDVDGQDLRIYDATPPQDGSTLKLIRGFNIPGPGKFAKPVFGDARAYVGARGALYAFGAPVNLPLNCSSPVAFPRTSVNSTSAALSINCTANVATQVTKFAISGNPNFVTEGLPTLPLNLAAGDQFSFKARFAPKQVGSLSSDVAITTNNQAQGSASTTPVTLTGSGNSAAGLFSINPITITFNSTFGAGEVQKSAFFNNEGDSDLTVTSVLYSVVSETGPWVTPNITDKGIQVAQFTFSNVPTTIAANDRQVVGIAYNPPEAGNHVVFVKANTSGGSKLLDVFGTTGSSPGAFYEFERADGTGWDPYVDGQNFTFGNVVPGTVRNLVVRITNNGSSSASPLGLTVSKPPFGVPGFVRAANSIDLAEGTIIAAGQSVNATMFCAPPERQLNTPSTRAGAGWRINTNTDQGAVILSFDCSSASPQVGPLLSNGTAKHGYIGCYEDETPGRQLSNNVFNRDNNTAESCINVCAAGGYTFSGMIFRRECWCGNALPNRRGTEADCTYRCAGDDFHACGGDGAAGNKHMISLFADSAKFDGVLESGPLTLSRQVGNYGFDGCYQEYNNVKSFNVKRQVTNVMTVEACSKFCAGSQLFGLQYASECYCGASIAGSSKQIADTSCDYTCKGNNSQFCGGSQRMQVYRLGSSGSQTTTSVSLTSTSSSSSSTTTQSTATNAPEVDGVSSRIGAYKYQGCYGEVAARALSVNSAVKARFNDDDNTNRICADFCAGSAYFGTEYGRECYCGDKLDTLSLPTDDGRCSMPCVGNKTEICGGENGLTLFKLDTSLVSSSTTTTVSTTLSSSSSSAGVESTSTTTSKQQPVSTPLVCPGSDGQTYVSNQKVWLVECGKDYPGNDIKAVSIKDNDLNACIDACAATTGCVNVALSGAACYLKKALGNPVKNGVWGARFLSNVQSSTTTTQKLTEQVKHIEHDINTIISEFIHVLLSKFELHNLKQLHKHHSVQQFFEYFNTTKLIKQSISDDKLSDNKLSKQQLTKHKLSNNDFKYSITNNYFTDHIEHNNPILKHLANEKPNGRALTEVYNNKTMTIEMCADEAKRRQLDYMGVEYGNECWLGSNITDGAVPLAQTRCTTICAGNSTTYCGGSQTLQMYQVNSTLVEPKKDAPRGVPLACPTADDTIFTTTNGATFRIECGWDRTGGSSSTVQAATYEACLESCSKTTGCKSVALSGKNCYLKTGTLGTQVRNDKIRGATLVTITE